KAKPGKADEAAPAPEKQEVKPAVQSAGAMAQPVFAPPPPLEGYHFSGVTEFQGRAKASPLAKRLADEKGLDVRSVKGSGPGGRVLARDLDSAQPAAVVGFGPRAVPDLAPGTYEEESLTPMRKAISRRLQEAKTFIPHFYVRQSIEVSPLIRLREELKDLGHKVSFNDLITRACALALRQHPIVNSGFNTANNTITRYKTVDIAIAVAMEAGLITPILRHADYKTVAELSSETRELAKRARAGKLEPHEYQGGSFTISNLGMYGIDDFIAVINPPQGAILSVGGILDQPVVKDGQVVAGKVMNLILSSDHRVIDGAAAAEFLQTVRKYLEKPVALVM
ncbi:MAG: 2-oxo acid dehydrogenase subunit E2, partial [Chlamydiia bacterium]|nr:2-oxo acid dehydrogenase subunit E2 [Chlamydiia bacterium]